MPEFDAEIATAEPGGAYVVVPREVVKELGGKGRIPVLATFDGIAYRGSVVSMGGEKILGMLKQIRTTLGKAPGDHVQVSVEIDEHVRRVDVPDDLLGALREAGTIDDFERLSYSHQREYVQWIEEAKKPETRDRRVRQTVARVGEAGSS